MRTNLMRSLALAALLAAAACQTMAGEAPVTATSANIVEAVADTARPQADRDLDDERKPAEMMAFAEVRPGDKVGELIPGAGFMTRILSKSVGPTGKVYLFNGPPAAGQQQRFQAVVDDKANYPNLQFVQTDFVTVTSPEPLDLVWTSQNYHDLHNPGRNIDLVAANKQILNALKPGGLYIVLDHSAKAGTGVDAALHRIEADMVKKEVIAAGFEFVGESDVLRNPADPRDKGVFDASIRRKTDQFILKFRKPG